MLAAIRKFVQEKLQPASEETAETLAHRTRLAAAALLVEIARADDRFSAAERAALLASMDRKFGLNVHEASRLIDLAEQQSQQATDLYQFTSEINRAFSDVQKVRLVEELWRAAFADHQLDPHEEHLIRRIADLIHVPHSAFIGTKIRVQTRTALPDAE